MKLRVIYELDIDNTSDLIDDNPSRDLTRSRKPYKEILKMRKEMMEDKVKSNKNKRHG